MRLENLKIRYWLIGLYVSIMGFVPLIHTHFEFNETYEIWKDWQTLTAGMIALFASLFALDAARVRQEKQRQRDFIAEKAFLPEVFAEILDYLLKCADFVQDIKNNEIKNDLSSPLKAPLPQSPENYKEVFRNCIAKAEPEFAKVLVDMLSELQVHQSRMKSLHETLEKNRSPKNRLPGGYYRSSLFRIAKLRGTINKNYDFARSEEEFIKRKLNWEDIRSGLRPNMRIDKIDELAPENRGFEHFAKGLIESEKTEI